MRSLWLQLLSVCLLVGPVAVLLTACGRSTVAGNAETDASATSVPQEEATPTDEPVSTEATEVPTSLPSPTSTEATAVPTSLPSPTSTEVTPTETATVTPVPPQEEQVDTMANSGNPDLDYAQVIFVKATQNSAGLWRLPAARTISKSRRISPKSSFEPKTTSKALAVRKSWLI
jgi:hypothetical protein